MNLTENMTLHGFRIKRVRELAELHARLVEAEHIKSGAHLCWLDRADENKAFSIAFKTVPSDSTGIFHILEHSVLCGSDKYPVKEPFVELLKSSVQTFLNAMTYPDKTVYPVSSRNDRDLLNLMDIYLDAVFHPAIYHKSEIFRQEGWRYERDGDDLRYQGVVLNEMKGVFASPESVLEHELSRLMFPDNCYRFESGGEPMHIPDLSYEQFVAGHRKFYHPSNARIGLVGSVDIDACLGKIDEYLREYDKKDVKFDIPMQAPVDAVERTVEYEIGADEPLEGRTVASRAALLGRFDDSERIFAACILADYLTGDNDAPLKRAVLSEALAQDIAVNVRDGVQQPWVSLDVWNTDADKLPRINELVRDTLESIAGGGMDRRRLEACFNSFAFMVRDRDSSRYPRSLVETLNMLDTWLYGGDPADALLVEDTLDSLSKKLNTGYFEDLIRGLFLDDKHGATVILTPSHTLGSENAAAEKARIDSESAAWTPEQKEKIEREAKELAAWQQTPDSPEALAKIPMLKVSDLSDKPEELPLELSHRGDTTVLRHAVDSDIVYLRTYFGASDLALEELPRLSVLCTVLGSVATARRGSDELQLLIKQKIGSLSIRPMIVAGSDPKHCRVMAAAFMSCMASEASDAAALLTEILTETDFSDVRALRDILAQESMQKQMSISSSGHSYAMMRVASFNTALGAAKEYSDGIEFAARLKDLSRESDETLEALAAELKALAQRVFAVERLTISCSDNADDSVLDSLAFPHGSAAPVEAGYEPIAQSREGVIIPASVGFAAKGSDLGLHGERFSGSMPVLANILNYVYLWNEIRVQGGAYGCGSVFRDSGEMCFYTYRDPQPNRSLDIMDGAASFVRDYCASKPDLTGPILSSVASLDPLLNTESRINTADLRYFKGTSYDDICAYYTQLVNTTPDDLITLCDALEEITADDTVCVVAGKSLIDACGDKLDSTRSI